MITAGLLCAATVCGVQTLMCLQVVLDGKDSKHRGQGLIGMVIAAFATGMAIYTIRWVNEIPTLQG